ncbi:MAG TPA: DUF192 domain-containing protein [Steroidobacteraceae bacterium]|nr:DUF192 domain-containing protein [Steroidobacteraceae bacterium]
MTRARRYLSPLAAAALMLSAGLAVADGPRSPDPLPLSAFPRERIVIETRSARRHVFEAWRADEPATRAQGLMFVEQLPADRAMIFIYDPPQRVGMWMKNTLVPLDMLFVDRSGCVVRVHAEAEPGSLETIDSGERVVLVVELAGGSASMLGIARGDRVLRPAAAWPSESAASTCPR